MSARIHNVEFEDIVASRYYPPTPENITLLNQDVNYYRFSKDPDERAAGLDALQGAVEYAIYLTGIDGFLSLDKQLVFDDPLHRINGLLQETGVVDYGRRI